MYSLEHVTKLCDVAKTRNFSFPKGFEQKSIPWLRCQYNGIGAEWMPSCVRKFVTRCFSWMEPAALIHDIEFMTAPKTYWNFTKANFRLAYNGLKSGCVFSGLSAAVICQLFGWSAWKEGKEAMSLYYCLNERRDK